MFPPLRQVTSYLAAADAATLAQSALGVVAVTYVAPPLAKASADKIRGYAGERGSGRGGWGRWPSPLARMVWRYPPAATSTAAHSASPPPHPPQATCCPPPCLTRWWPTAATC